MLFSSFEFIFLFLPITLAVFFWLGHRHLYQGAIGWLVFASLFYYGYWNPAYIGLLLFSKGFNYGMGLLLRSPPQRLAISGKWLLVLGLGGNLALLGYFKYANFFADNINALAGTEFHLEKIVLPLGISFFTFQNIAYLVDTYNREIENHNFLKYALFVSFFPQLIAGPIVHHKEVLPQFDKPSIFKFSEAQFMVGLTIFIVGLFKKTFIADSVAVYGTPVFEAANVAPVTFIEAWIGILAYTLQLYFDFSGYSDMAIGGARMFGIKLPLNFNSPYKAVNISDFWRRWHMTLSRFLRDYLYIPLGGNRKGEPRRYLNLMITMLLGGLWHGAGWTFVIWGGLHGLGLAIHRQWQLFRKALGHNLQQSTAYGRWLGRTVTFLFVLLTWVFFRAENSHQAFVMLQGMAGMNGFSLPKLFADKFAFLKEWGIQFNGFVPFASFGIGDALFWLLLALPIAWFAPNTQEWMGQHEPAYYYRPETEPEESNSLPARFQWQPTMPFAILIGVVVFLIAKISVTAKPTEFLYFNF